MRILLTNDDGINAPGLEVLYEIASELSDEIWICAPEADQSGLAHSLSLNEPMRLRQLDERRYALKGTPTDCVIMGVRELMSEQPDLILSGVNAGLNISDDVTYSGTVAAAMEGALLGINSIALSQGYDWDKGAGAINWDATRAHGPDLIKKLIGNRFPHRTFMNLNFPNCAAKAVKGTRVTHQGNYTHGLYMQQREDGRGIPYYWLRFGRDVPTQREGSDVEAIADNWISATPLKMDLTDHDFAKNLASNI